MYVIVDSPQQNLLYFSVKVNKPILQLFWYIFFKRIWKP